MTTRTATDPATDPDPLPADFPCLTDAQHAELCARLDTYAPLDPQGQEEPSSDYRHRVLTHALKFGISELSLSQCEQADRAAQLAVTALPQHLDPMQARLDVHLHTLRLRLSARMAEKHAQLASLQRSLDLLAQDASRVAIDAPGGVQRVDGPPESDADRATKLLRAALVLIMGQPPRDGGGGSGARLIPPTPKLPSGGQARRPGDDVDF